jgi:hypothetical protein
MTQVLKIAQLILLTFIIVGCESGGGNADAEAFCDCFGKLRAGVDDTICDREMDKLESAFLSDQERYEDFRKATNKTCPEAKEIVIEMGPLPHPNPKQ